MPALLERKLERVRTILRGYGRSPSRPTSRSHLDGGCVGWAPRVVVAFSGGVDSTLLAALASDVLGKMNVLAVTADSPSMARADLEEARRLAAQLDFPHLVVTTGEVTNAAYRANTDTRCYFCKHELFDTLEALAAARQIHTVLYGAIGGDQLSERPGQRAAAEYRVQAPLQEAGIEKWEVRALAKSLGLPNWNRPQNACLSSRIPHGTEVTEQRLRQVEDAEGLVRAQGFRQVRVRHLGTRARIEVGVDELPKLEDGGLRRQIATALQGCGFSLVEFDARGYRSTGADS